MPVKAGGDSSSVGGMVRTQSMGTSHVLIFSISSPWGQEKAGPCGPCRAKLSPSWCLAPS